MAFSKIKSYGVVPSAYMKMMKQKSFQAWSLKHSIFVLGKLSLFESSRESPPISPNAFLGYAPGLITQCHQSTKVVLEN